jgi:hypothetical protein
MVLPDIQRLLLHATLAPTRMVDMAGIPPYQSAPVAHTLAG